MLEPKVSSTFLPRESIWNLTGTQTVTEASQQPMAFRTRQQVVAALEAGHQAVADTLLALLHKVSTGRGMSGVGWQVTSRELVRNVGNG